ncbi:MAG: META domain-containing protein [Gemmatimonadetes bacterium]|nr:META domain-containing protein [Gemmatimonadota bacterium]
MITKSCRTSLWRSLLLPIAVMWFACGETTPLTSTDIGESPVDVGQAARITTDILGQDWVLVAFVAADGTVDEALPGQRVTLAFQADGTLGGNGGCNGYGASWSQSEDDGLVVGGILSTLMACSEPVGISEQEQRLFRSLEQTRQVSRTGQTLRLDVGNTGDHLLFDLIVREQARPEPFTGIGWELEAFERLDDGVILATPVIPGSRLTAWFDEDGTVRGSTGCNAWGGSWSEGGDGGLFFEDLGSTDRACSEPAGVMAQEQRFLDALIMTARVTSRTELLRLTSADGSMILHFVPTSESGQIVSIRGGTSFGHCLGYCWEELRFDTAGILLLKGGWDAAAYPERRVSRVFEDAAWQSLIGMEDVFTLFRLDQVIGCPDCADGGAEWVEIQTTDGRRRVTYEYGSAPKEIADLALALQTLREQLRQDFGVATVILE